MAVFFSITACKIKIKKQIIYFQYTIAQNMQHHSKKLKRYYSEKTLDHSKAKSHQGKLQIPLLHVWCKRVVDCNKFIFFEILSQTAFSGKYLMTLASLATPWGVHHNPVLTLKVLCNECTHLTHSWSYTERGSTTFFVFLTLKPEHHDHRCQVWLHTTAGTISQPLSMCIFISLLFYGFLHCWNFS